MNRQLLFLVLIAVACSNCDTKTDNPKTTSRNTENVSQPPKSAAQEASAPSTEGSSQGRVGANTSPIHDQGQYVRFADAGVKLVRPDGFDDAEKFHGFQQQSSQSWVMVAMIAGPFSEITAGFTAEQLKTRGMTLGSKENVQIDGNPGVLLHVTQYAHGTEFAKWIAVFGNERETRMVTAMFPKSNEAVMSSQLKAVVLSAKADVAPPPTPGTDVGFAITASKKLKLTRGIGKMLVYTKGGVVPAKSPEDPLFVAAPSFSKTPIHDKSQFAVQRIFQTAHTKIISVTSNSKITIDGLDGYELVADAEDAGSGASLTVYQVMLFDNESYILIQGIVGAELRGEYLPEFKTMARSLARNPR